MSHIRHIWFCILILEFVIGYAVVAQHNHYEPLELAREWKQDSEKRLEALLHHFPAKCPKKRTKTAAQFSGSSANEIVDSHMSQGETHIISSVEHQTDPSYQRQHAKEFGQSKPQTALLDAEKEVIYHYRCPRSGAATYKIEWKVQKFAYEYGVRHVNIEHAHSFGAGLYHGRGRPWWFGNYFTSSFCIQLGAWQCAFGFVGYYHGEIWRNHMQMYFIDEYDIPEIAPKVRESCQFNIPGYPLGRPIEYECEVIRIEVYTLV